jgi:erythronate-4-phosphate dehydrogenase
MKVVADDKIPFLKGVLEPFADVVYVNGKSIGREDLKDADALIVRTRTRCNEELLGGTKVKFVGTATIGFDHIDTRWCEANGIKWTNAPGCNSSSVKQYIASTLISIAEKFGFSLADRVLGVVGVGNVGSKIIRLADLLGMKVYLCDPPKVRSTGTCGFISLAGIIRECDIITFHVPLTLDGQDKTYHMINEKLLSSLNPGTVIINSSRGEVADTAALKYAVKQKQVTAIALDVWEKEPDIDPDLLEMCSLATPHIAGYSVDGKANGTSMIIQELSKHFGLELDDWTAEDLIRPLQPMLEIDCMGRSVEEILKTAILHTYDVREDDRKLRTNPGSFEKLRGEYPPRREFEAYTLKLKNADQNVIKTCEKLGFKIG